MEDTERIFVLRVSLVILGVAWLGFLGRSLSMVLVFIIQMLLGKTSKRSSGVRALVGHIVALSQLFVYFCFVTVATIISRIVQYLPFLVFVFLLSTVYNNYSEGLLAVMDSYNNYIVKTEFFRGIELVQSFGRIVFEVITPAANFVVDFFRILPVEVLRLLLDQSMLNDITKWTTAVASLLTDVVLAAGNFILRERNECADAAVVQSFEASQRSIAPVCLDADYRSVALYSDDDKYLGEIAQYTTNIVQRLCPLAASPVSLLLFPLAHPDMGRVLDAALNAVVSIVYTTWRMCTQRCRIALEPGNQRTSLCAPDLGPFFVHVERTVHALGLVLDAWIEAAFEFTLMLYVERKPAALGGECGSSTPVPQDLDASSGHVLALDGGLYATVKADSATFYERNAEPYVRKPTNTTFVHLRYGVVPIDYDATAGERVAPGRGRTSAMGCRCLNDLQQGPLISCPVFTFDAQGTDADEDVPEIPVVFADATPEARRNIQCSQLHISVQPLGRDLAVRDVGAGLPGGCLAGGEGCAFIDAAVYVMLECGTGIGMPKCVEDAKNNLCAPFCVGVRQMGAGMRPIFLTNAATLFTAGGQVLLNILCLPDAQEGSDSIASFSAQGETTPIKGFVDADSYSRCDYSAYSATFKSKFNEVRDAIAKFVAAVEQMAQDTPADSSPSGTVSDETSDVFDDYIGFGLPARAPDVPKTNLNGRVKFVRDVQQPFVFAGQYMLYENRTREARDGFRNAILARLELTTANSITLRTVMENIPIRDNLVPDESMSLLQQHNLGASMPGGVIFYAVNPDLDGLSGLFVEGSTTMTYKIQAPRLVRIDPLGECSGGTSIAAQTTRFCGPKLVQSVPLFNNAWMEDSALFLRELWNKDFKTDLYIDAVSRISDTHLLVTVRHGPLCALGIEITELRTDARVLDCVRMTSIKTLYVDAKGLTWSNTAPAVGAAVRVRDAVFCDAEHRLPPVFGIASGFGVVALRSLKVVVNDFVVNGIGIIEDLVTTKDACHGGALLHSAYDHCSTTRPRPLSLLPVHAAVVELHVAWRLAVERVALLAHRVFNQNERQMEKFLLAAGLGTFGPEAAPLRTILAGTIARVLPASLNVAAALPRIAGEAAMLSLYYGTFVYDYYVLPLGTYLLQKLAREEPIDGLWQRTVATHYSVMTGGAFDNMVMVPLERTCSVAAQLAYDPQNPVGRALFYGCRASIESVRLVLTVVADVLVIPNVANCVCDAITTNTDVVVALERACGDAMPDNLKYTYIGMIQDAQKNYILSDAVCLAQRTDIRRRLFAAPTRLVRLVTRFGDALADTAAFLPSLTKLAGLEARECARPERNIDGAVMLPQPLVSFMACGLTPTCRTKCGQEITWFEETRAREDFRNASQKYRQENKDTFLPVFGAQGGDVFVPLAAQAYVKPNKAWLRGDYACMYDIVVLTRPVDKVRGDWSLRMFCMQTELADNLLLQRVEKLPGTAFWYTKIENPEASVPEGIRVEQLTLAPKVHDAMGNRVFAAALYVQTYNPVSHVTVLHRFTAETSVDGVKYEILLQAQNILPLLVPRPDARQLLFEITKQKDFYDSCEIVPPSKDDEYDNQRLRLPTFFRATTSLDDLSVHYTARHKIKLRHTVYGEYFLDFSVVARFSALTNEHQVVLRRDELIAGLGLRDIVLSTEDGTKVYVAKYSKWCEYSVHDFDFLHNMTIRKDKDTECLGMSYTSGGRLFTSPDVHVAGTIVPVVDATDVSFLQSKACLLAANLQQYSSSNGWLSEINFNLKGDLLGGFEPTSRNGVTTTLIVEYEAECTYLTCNSCSNAQVRQVCQGAQNCAITECIGTRVHMSNVFCSAGLLVREIGELEFKDFLILWQGLVELLATALEGGKPLTKSGGIEVEALSNMLVTTMCETKDIVAVGSTVLPTLIVTIQNAIEQSFLQRGPLRQAFSTMSRIIAPAKNLIQMQQVLAASQFLYQIALGVVQYFYVQSRILMCAARSFSMLTGGAIQLVDLDVNIESDVCSLMLVGDGYMDETVQSRISSLTSSFRLTTTGVNSVQDARKQSLVSPGTSMPVGVFTSLASVFVLDKTLTSRTRSFCANAKCPSSKSLKMLPDRRILLFYLTALFDFITGVLYGIASIGKVAQEEKCSIRPAIFKTSLECVCGDKPVYIRNDIAREKSNFWCRGILRMVDMEGVERYISQPYSYSELVDEFEADGKAYLTCISTRGAQRPECNNMLTALNNKHTFDDVKISPVAVMMRCRENFFLKRWDPGLFAAFHTETRNMSKLPDPVINEVAKNIADLNTADVENCLKRGPTEQSIEQCTAIFFQQQGQSFEDADIRNFFMYQTTLPFGRDEDYGDACEFLSSDTLPQSIQDKRSRCYESELSPTYRQLEDTGSSACNISFTTQTITSMRHENVLESFRDETAYTVDDEKYKEELNWLYTHALDPTEIVPSLEALRTYSMQLHSFEGDLVHTMMDCMVQGPYPEFSFMPADPTGFAANLSYQRPHNYTMCDKPQVMDILDPVSGYFVQKTCGSPTRISLINSFLRTQQDRLVHILRSKIKAKVEDLRLHFQSSNLRSFRSDCAGEYIDDDACLPSYQLSEDTFRVDMSDILFDNSDTGIVHFLQNNLEKNLLRFQTADYNTSLESYADFKEVLMNAQVSYPTNGALHNDVEEYNWPLDNPELTLQAQCEYLLSTKIWTTRTELREDFLSLEALNQLFEPGEEWRPYDIGTADERTREYIVQYLRDYDTANHPLADMYDVRLMPLQSSFCYTEQVSNAGPQKLEIQNFRQGVEQLLGDTEPDILDMFPREQDLLRWTSEQSMSIGGMARACPCTPIGYTNSDPTICAISKVVCNIKHNIPWFQSKCDESIEDEIIEYGAEHAANMRRALRVPENARTLRESDSAFVCPSFLPSSLWHFNASAEGLLLHSTSGVSATNLDFIKSELGKVLGEDHRVLAFENLSIPICQDKNASKAEQTAFPAAHVVATSPAVVACVRYVVDSVWVHALKAAGVEDVQDANTTAELWRTRCQAKVNKLRSCQHLGMYERPTVSPESSHCPYQIEEPASSHYLLHSACLVRNNGAFFDPFRCKHCTGTSCTIDKKDLVDACKIADPLRILVQHDNTEHAYRVPGLSQEFVDDVLHRQDNATRDLLFPETGADASEWFRVSLHEAWTPGEKFSAPPALLDFLKRDPEVTQIHVSTEELLTLDLPTPLTSRHYFEHNNHAWFPKASLDSIRQHDYREHGACFHSLPYWPPTWQAPLGESMSERVENAAGFANYLAVVDGREIHPLHRVLHPEHESERYYGTTGVCREHNIGMPLADINTHSLCTSTQETDSEVCSATAEADTGGGGFGRNLGSLFNLLRFWLDENTEDLQRQEFWNFTGAQDRAAGADVSEDTVAELLRTQCNTFPDHLTEVLRTLEHRPSDRECNTTRECEARIPGTVCRADARCHRIEVDVWNRDDNDIEIGFASPGCDTSPEISGASPWKRARHFFAQHGMCAHRNTITYERMLLTLNNSNNTYQQCELRTHGNWSYFECARNTTEWDWIRENPRWWARKAGPGVLPGEPEYNMRSVGDLGEFDLDPHPCDYDVMHAHDWGFCRATHTDDAQAAYSYWMRLAASHDNFTVYVDRDREDAIKDEISEDKDGWNKLRFLGLERAALKRDKGPNVYSRVSRCRNFGYCEAGDHRIGGVQVYRYVIQEDNHNVSVFYEMDNVERCGPMGIVLENQPSRCRLDPAVTQLFLLAMKENSACQNVFGKTQNLDALFAQVGDRWQYESSNRETVRLVLNEYFTLQRASVALQSLNSTWHEKVIQCVQEVADAGRVHHENIRLGKPSSQLPVNVTPGIYLFFEYAAAEVPQFWWLKYALERALNGVQDNIAQQYRADIIQARSINAVVHSYRNRGALPASQNLLGTMWASLNTQKVFDRDASLAVFFKTTARWLHSAMSGTLRFARPKRLALSSRMNNRILNLDAFARCFETATFPLVDTDDRRLTTFCNGKTGEAIGAAEITLRKQFSAPFVVGNAKKRASDVNPMFTLDDSEFLENEHGTMRFFEILVKNVYESLSAEEKTNTVKLFSPYNGPQIVDVVEDERGDGLPVMHIRPPNSEAWKTGLRVELKKSIEEFLDEMDQEGDFLQSRQDYGTQQTTSSQSDMECLFDMQATESWENLARLKNRVASLDQQWPHAVFYYDDDNKSRTINLCAKDDDKGKAPQTTFQPPSRSSSCFFNDIFKEDTSDKFFNTPNEDPGFQVELPIGNWKGQRCGNRMCCPDHLAYGQEQTEEDKPNFRASSLPFSFASLYKESNKHYKNKRDAHRRRCIRTDSTCFKKHDNKYRDTMWNGGNCIEVGRITLPKIFTLKAWKLRTNLGFSAREILMGDRVSLHQNSHGFPRILLSLQESHEHIRGEHIFAAPEWSFCPEDPTNAAFFMHKFKIIDLAEAKTKLHEYSTTKGYDRDIDGLISQNEKLRSWTLRRDNFGFGKLQSALYDETETVATQNYQQNAMQVELGKFLPWWCGAGDPRTNLIRAYDLGACYDDNILVKTKPEMVTKCEYLGRTFHNTNYKYFMDKKMNVRDLYSLRAIEFFTPFNPEVNALQTGLSGKTNTDLMGLIEADFIPRSANGKPTLKLGEGDGIQEMTRKFMSHFCEQRLHGGGSVNRKECDKMRKDLLMRRHLLKNYEWGRTGNSFYMDSDEDYTLAPCLPANRAFRSESTMPSYKRFSTGALNETNYRLPANSKKPGEFCWDECQHVGGLCNNFCGGGACCRRLWWEDNKFCQEIEYGDAVQRSSTVDHICVHQLNRDYWSPRRSLLPAMDVAMDYMDREGFCEYGGSHMKLDLVPHQWLLADDILRGKNSNTKILVPCDPDCEIDSKQKKCEGCEHMLELVEFVEPVEGNANHMYDFNEHICSLEFIMQSSHLCGSDFRRVYDDCRSTIETTFDVDIFTVYQYSLTNPVAWECMECHKYDPTEFVDFAFRNNATKLGWGLYFNNETVYDSNGGGALQELKITLPEIINNLQGNQRVLQSILNDENKINSVNLYLQNDTLSDTRYEIYHLADEMQKHDPLPVEITEAFLQFGHEPPEHRDVGCKLHYAEQQLGDDCGVPGEDVETELAFSASEQLQMSLAGGCRAKEQDTQVHKEVCTSYLTETDTRYQRLKRFADEVLNRAFGLPLPELAPRSDQRLNISGADWIAGVLPYYAHSKRLSHTRRHVYLDYITNDKARCKKMYRSSLLSDAPCFEDHNETVHLLNPWLGGNYSFIQHFALVTEQDYTSDKTKFHLQAGFDTCTFRQTVSGENLQPCQGYTCIPLQSMAAIHPDDVNRTVCRYSTVLSGAYKQNELLLPTDLKRLTRFDNLGELYRVPDNPTLCDAEYPSIEEQGVCEHAQATLGFSPMTQRGRATPAPSLNRSRTDARQRVDASIARDVLRIGMESLARLLWAGNTYDREQHGDAKYVALAVFPEHTAPARVRLQVARSGALLVHDVGLLPAGTRNPGTAWISSQHVGVEQDREKIRNNGLYNSRHNASGHWACPLLVREAVTGARYPALHVLQPDPGQARAAFPDLDGAHPALHTRPVLPAQLARYRMLGLHRVVPNTTHSHSFTHEDARALARAFLRNNGTLLDVERSTETAREACLRWPNVHAQSAGTRSGEDYAEHTACQAGHKSDLVDVFAGRTLLRVNPENTKILSGRDTGGEAAARAHACFRAPLVRMTRAQFNRLNGSEFLRCRDTTVGRNITARNISCWRATGEPEVFTFPTTHRPERGRQFWETLPPPESAPCWDHRSTTSELSLHARQSLSPLRARLRRANLTHWEPLQIWAKGVDAILAANEMQAVPAVPPGGTPWLGSTCDGSALGLSKDLDNWHKSLADRREFCKASLATLAENNTCAPRETFIDLCDIKELRDMCSTVRAAMQYFLRLNMAAAGRLLRTRMYYMPDRYMHADGEFASTAVVAAYAQYKGSDDLVCDDWRFSDELMQEFVQTNDRNVRDTCIEAIATTIIQRMSLLRQVVFGIVDFTMLILQFFVDIAMYLGVAMLEFTTQSQFLTQLRDGIGRNIVEGGTEIGRVFVELFQDLIDAFVQLVLDFFLTKIQLFILQVCGWFEAFYHFILSIIQFIENLANIQIINPEAELDNNICFNFAEYLTGFVVATETAQSLIADQCYSTSAGVGVDLPSGFLGGVNRRFTCGLTSMCLRDALAVPEELQDDADISVQIRSKQDLLPAIPCGTCPGREFTCDNARKRCKCGPKTAPVDQCQTTKFCRDPTMQATCRFSQDGDPDFSALAQRCAEIDNRFIACVYSSVDNNGQCQALPENTAEKIGFTKSFALVQPFSFLDFSRECKTIESFGIVPNTALLSAETGDVCLQIGTAKINVPVYETSLVGRGRRLLAAVQDSINMTAVASTFLLGMHAVLEPAAGTRTPAEATPTVASAHAATGTPGQYDDTIPSRNTTLATGTPGQDDDTIPTPNTTAAARRLLAAMAFQHLNFSALEAFRDTLSLSQSAGVDFTLLPLTKCTSSKTVQFEFFLRNFAEQLAGARWRARPECTSGDPSLLERLTRPCPVVQNVFDRLANNTAVLAQYYLHVTNSGCLDVNLNQSCVPEIKRAKRESASELWPWFPEHDYRRADLKQWNISSEGCGDNIPLYDPVLRDMLDERAELKEDKSIFELLRDSLDVEPKQDKSMFELSTQDLSNITTAVSMYHCVKSAKSPGVAYLPTAVEVSNTSANQSVAVQSITSAVNFITVDIFALNKQYYSSLFFNVISLEAMHNDDEYERMIKRHEYSVGRMVRDFTTCSYRDTVFCPQQQHSLLLCFVTMFVFLLLVTSLLPIPSVLTFFMWTLGLTVGVVYLAYGFSPLCAPLVPNCLGDGLRDTLVFFFPKNLTIPRKLVDTSVCDINGTRLPGQTGDCLKSCRTLNVYGALDVLMHAEAFFTSGVYFGLTWEPKNATGCVQPRSELQDFMTANVNGYDTVVLKARDHAEALKGLPAEALKCNVTYCAKGTGSPAWRPVGGLPVTDVIVHAVRRVLEPWIGSEDALWVVLRDKECHALKNVHTDDNDQRLGVFICMLLGVFDVLAWGIVLLLGIPVFIYVVQYFVLLNLVLLQIFMDNYIVANREF